MLISSDTDIHVFLNFINILTLKLAPYLFVGLMFLAFHLYKIIEVIAFTMSAFGLECLDYLGSASPWSYTQ